VLLRSKSRIIWTAFERREHAKAGAIAAATIRVHGEAASRKISSLRAKSAGWTGALEQGAPELRASFFWFFVKVLKDKKERKREVEGAADYNEKTAKTRSPTSGPRTRIYAYQPHHHKYILSSNRCIASSSVLLEINQNF